MSPGSSPDHLGTVAETMVDGRRDAPGSRGHSRDASM